ncbi:MAG: hypothetical protein M0P11_06185 [Anaerolineaceae bacterium]|nr:hypothetical protein [Anaerolineaceae bacterium]
MNKKLILIFGVLLLVVTACNFPVGKKTATPMPTPTPDTSMQLYYGQGMQIMLPPSYIAEDIKTQLPNIIETLTNLVGDSEGFARDLIREIEGNVAWYGFDGDTPAVYPTRLIVIRNKSLAALPVGIITLGLEQVLGRNQTEVDRDSLTLNGRDVTRFTYSKDSNAFAAYLFKEQHRLWISVFITTPANMAVSLTDYNTSIGSMQIDPIAE